jgi:hypothetical protein
MLLALAQPLLVRRRRAGPARVAARLAIAPRPDLRLDRRLPAAPRSFDPVVAIGKDQALVALEHHHRRTVGSFHVGLDALLIERDEKRLILEQRQDHEPGQASSIANTLLRCAISSSQASAEEGAAVLSQRGRSTSRKTTVTPSDRTAPCSRNVSPDVPSFDACGTTVDGRASHGFAVPFPARANCRFGHEARQRPAGVWRRDEPAGVAALVHDLVSLSRALTRSREGSRAITRLASGRAHPDPLTTIAARSAWLRL